MAKRSPHNAPDTVRFRRLAHLRLEDAKVLSNFGRNTIAIYLAGYAVECALKALLLSNTPVAGHRRVLESFRGSRAHDFEWLKFELRQRRIYLTPPLTKLMNDVAFWSIDLRYDPAEKPEEAAADFLKSAEAIIDWVEGRL